MLRRSLLFLSEREALKNLLFKMPAAREVAGRFVAGESLADALRAARELNEAGFRVTLDYLGESVRERAAAEQATRAYEQSLEEIADSGVESTISLKLTQLGLDIDEDLCAANVERIVSRAAALDNFVRIDMEDSAHTAVTLRIFHRAFEAHRNVGVVLQSYLHRTEADAEQLIRLGAPVRLCKGAYSEPPEVAYQRKLDIDASFVHLMKRLLDGVAAVYAPAGQAAGGVARQPARAGNPPTDGDAEPSRVPRVAIASHDHKMIEATREYARARDISPRAFEFQMLYGVRRDYQTLLAEAGYQVRVYVPYGTQWYAYFMRRMAERPANLWFVVRAITGN